MVKGQAVIKKFILILKLFTDKVVDKYITQEKYCSAVQLCLKFLQVLSLNDQIFSDSKGEF